VRRDDGGALRQEGADVRLQSIDETTRPILAPGTTVCQADGEVVVATMYPSDYAFKCANAGTMRYALSQFDGRSTVSDVSRDFGVDLSQLRDVLQPLAADGIVVDVSQPLGATDPEAYMEAFCAIGDFWALNIFDQPFWHLMRSGGASRDILLGWGIQFYHRVCGANVHNSIAASGATDPKIRAWLSRHYREESDHARIFLRGLAQDGLPEAEAVNRAALPTTQQLIEHSIRLARTDQIAYSSLDSLQQSPRHGQTVELINEQFDRMCALYPYAEGALNAFRRHTLFDVELEHSDIVLDKMVREFGPPPPEQTLKMLTVTRELVEHFHAFFDGILKHFSSVTLPGGAPH
jgi:pyrroloquinoline quinone (PQQ) biosynthesis protein C